MNHFDTEITNINVSLQYINPIIILYSILKVNNLTTITDINRQSESNLPRLHRENPSCNHRVLFPRYAESATAVAAAIFRDFDLCMLHRLLVSPRRASVSWHRRHRVDTPLRVAHDAFARTLVLSLAHAARWVCRARESELPTCRRAC